MFGAKGKARYSTSVTFTSKAAIRNGLQKKLDLKKKLLPVKKLSQYIQEKYGVQ
jgi:urease subunit alpha